MAPPAGVDDNNDLTQRALDAALDDVMNSQFEIDSEISKHKFFKYSDMRFCCCRFVLC